MIPQSILRWVEEKKGTVVMALVGLVMVGAGIFWYKSSGSQEQEGIQVLSVATQSSVGSTSKNFKVDISGAVVNPGVYELGSEDRVENVLVAAGGLAQDADTKWIEKNLNRAAKLIDGQKIYIPRLGEEIKSQIPQLRQGFEGQANSNIISINTGSQVELESLPGIGPVTAGKIISARPYSGIEELVQKKIVGQKVYDQIKDKIGL